MKNDCEFKDTRSSDYRFHFLFLSLYQSGRIVDSEAPVLPDAIDEPGMCSSRCG
jgi:hypothetical protein